MANKMTTCLWFDKGEARKATAAKRAFEAMMTMQKIDIARIESALSGETINA